MKFVLWSYNISGMNWFNEHNDQRKRHKMGHPTLHVWGVHVMTRGNDSWLEGLLATTVLDCRRLGGRCPMPGLPVLMLQMCQHCPVGASVGSLTDFGGVGR